MTSFYVSSLYMGTGEGSQGSSKHSCATRPRVTCMRITIDGRGLHVKVLKEWPWTIVSNVCGECIFVDFGLE